MHHFLGSYLPASSLRKRLAVGMSWVMAGSVFRQVANFLAVIFVARVLGMTDFGKLAVIQSTVMMISSFGQAGIGLSTTKYVASNRATDPERTGRIIGFSMLFALFSSSLVLLGLVLCSSFIEQRLLPGANLSLELQLSGAWAAFEILCLVEVRILAGLESFRSCANITFCQGALLPLVLAGAHLGGVAGAILAYAAVELVNSLFGYFLLTRQCRKFGIEIRYRGSWSERGILRMSAMVWLSATAMNLTNWVVGIVLARQPNGIQEYALFNAASHFQNVLAFLPSRIFHVSVPILASLQAEGNRPGFTKTLAGLSGLSLAVTTAGAVFFLVFSEHLMSWYGKGFARGGGVLVVVALLCLASSVWTVASAGLWAAEQSRQMLSLDIFRGGLLLALCLSGVAATAKGLAFAHLVSYTVGSALLILALYRYLRQPWGGQQPVLKTDL